MGPAPTEQLPRTGRSRAIYAAPVQRLITELSKLPGIGNRTAQRLAFHILRLEPAAALALAELPYAVGAVLLGDGVVNRHVGWMVALGLGAAALSLSAVRLLQRRLDPP